ncbi:hypothetical protein SBY92_005049 [Candida maltosa Xu316]
MSEEEDDNRIPSSSSTSSSIQPPPPTTSSSSSHQTLDSQPKSASSETTDFTSPSKSLKSFFFKNRLSNYSIDSITEQPELEEQQQQQVTLPNKKASIGSQELSPSKSPRLLTFNLRPKFIRSRSSGLSDTNSTTQSIQPPTSSSAIIPTHRRATIEDFADTESEESKEDLEDQSDMEEEVADKTADSINSVLQEYHNRDSEYENRDSKKFVFQEEFDDTSIKTKSRPQSKVLSHEENEELKAEIMRHGSVRSSGSVALKPIIGGINRSAAQQQFIDTHLAQQHLGDTRKQIEVIDPILPSKQPSSATTESDFPENTATTLKRISAASNSSSNNSTYNENRNSAASSANSVRFKIQNDKIEQIKSKHISTSTTNAEAAAAGNVNRSSLRESVLFSDESEVEIKYPEPTVTPFQTPRVPRERHSDSSPSTDNTNSTSNNNSSVSYEVPVAIAGMIPRSSSGSSVHSSRVPHHQQQRSLSSQVSTPTKSQSKLQEQTDETVLVGTSAVRTSAIETVANKTTSTTSDMYNETMLKDVKHASLAARSSMSSGELLQNLEQSYDYSKSNENSGNSDDTKLHSESKTNSVQGPVYEFTLEKNPPLQSPPSVHLKKDYAPDSIDTNVIRTSVPRSSEVDKSANMTAGLDASNKLPVMLFKVQDRDLADKQYKEQKSTNHPHHHADTSSSTDRSRHSTRRPVDITVPETRSGGSTSTSSNASIKHIINKHFRTIGDNINPTNQPKLVTVSPPKPTYQRTFDEKDLMQIPTPPSDSESQSVKFIEYPWLRWSLLMVLGLIIPPLYFLIPIGVLDGGYTGLRYANKQYRRFNKKQKIISFIFGILWLLIVLAMIGVGIGLGVTREG